MGQRKRHSAALKAKVAAGLRAGWTARHRGGESMAPVRVAVVVSTYACRRLDGHDQILFLQDDCVVHWHNWVSDFVGCFEGTARCGLVGAHLNRSWDRPWTELTGGVERTGPDSDVQR